MITTTQIIITALTFLVPFAAICWYLFYGKKPKQPAAGEPEGPLACEGQIPVDLLEIPEEEETETEEELIPEPEPVATLDETFALSAEPCEEPQEVKEPPAKKPFYPKTKGKKPGGIKARKQKKRKKKRG